MFTKEIQDKRSKYLNNESIVLGSYSYLDKKPCDLNFEVRDFNDKVIFYIPAVGQSYQESLKVAIYLYECFEAVRFNGFEAYADYPETKSELEDLISSHFNKNILLEEICFITNEDYDLF